MAYLLKEILVTTVCKLFWLAISANIRKLHKVRACLYDDAESEKANNTQSNLYPTQHIVLKFRFSENATKILTKHQNKWDIFFQNLWPSHNFLILKQSSFKNS